MSADAFHRRDLLKGAGALPFASMPVPATLAATSPTPARLSLNENPFGPAPGVKRAIEAQLGTLDRYADAADALTLTQRIAALEGVSPEQIVLGEILDVLGRQLAGQGTPGGRFIHSVPGYTALVDAAKPFGGVPVPVPLDARLRNNLPVLAQAISGDTRALYFINPHNPTGTVNTRADLDDFLASAAARALVIVDEAYLDYDDPSASAVRLTRSGRNVAVFRTLDKIHGLAALPFGYTVAPVAVARSLREAGVGDPHGLGRLTITAASAALADRSWTFQVRRRTLAGRARLEATLDKLGLERSESHANFVFFKSPVPADGLRARLAEAGILVGRPFPPLDAWIRITVGTEEEVTRTIAALLAVLASRRAQPRA